MLHGAVASLKRLGPGPVRCVNRAGSAALSASGWLSDSLILGQHDLRLSTTVNDETAAVLDENEQSFQRTHSQKMPKPIKTLQPFSIRGDL